MQKQYLRSFRLIVALLFTSLLITEYSVATSAKKIGVLLVNHGSRSATWRNVLLSLEDSVRASLLQNPNITGTKTAFMEYNEPSIATRLKEFDSEGYSDIIIIPIFLTISPHTFDDIPTIIGQKEDPTAIQMLKIEKIARYTPRAKIYITPNLDYANILKSNILRRVKLLSMKPAEEGIVMIAYGDETYENEWRNLLDEVGLFIKQRTGISIHSYGWCGHVAHYDPQKTADAIEKVLTKKQKALVIPVLVAHDEMFQIKIIGDGIAKIHDNKNRVRYKPDSILPDENIEEWIITITNIYVQKIQDNFSTDIKK
jgi:hypothetical protein